VQLRYDETSLDFVASEEYEAIVTPITAAIDGSALLQVDYDDRDLRTEAPQGIRYVLPAVPVDTATFWKSAETDLRNHLVQSRSMTVLQNQQLKLASRPGESREEFLARCQVAAEEREDTAADKLRIATQKKLDALEMTVMKAKGRVEQLQTDTTTRRGNELLQGCDVRTGCTPRREEIGLLDREIHRERSLAAFGIGPYRATIGDRQAGTRRTGTTDRRPRIRTCPRRSRR
jgi:hypothetical protein